MKRIYKEIGNGLAQETPFVELTNGNRTQIETEDGNYKIVSVNKVVAAGLPIDAPDQDTTEKRLTAVARKTRTFKLRLTIDNTNANNKACVVYIGLGQALAGGVEALDFGVSDILDDNAVINGTFGDKTLKTLCSLAFQKGVQLKNWNVEALQGSFFDVLPTVKEFTPDARTESERDVIFPMPSAKDTNTNIRIAEGFAFDLNGFSYLKVTVPMNEKVSFTFDAAIAF